MEQALMDKDRERGEVMVKEDEETREIFLVRDPWEIVFVLPVEKK